QTCMLDDYVAIRPENRGRLELLIRSGRILIGPWFTMPDLFCPGDEGLIRNLLLGHRVCREWGVGPMPVAYTCDMFGHPSQMAQIYRGFGLGHCVLGRGANEHTTPTFFNWEAPDGSQVFCFKLQDRSGYGAFVGARRALEQAGPQGGGEAEERARESLREYIDHEIGRCNGRVLCLMDALDHMPPATDAPRYVRIVEEACPDVSAMHSTLPAFFADAERLATDVPVKRGELREPAKNLCSYLWLIPNCVSARIVMKQANDACQSLLEHWCEPFSAIAAVEGVGLPRTYLREAWRNVLLNHAHDSICGCSIDQVHRDMMHRFDQARLIADQLRKKLFAALSRGCKELGGGPDEFTIIIANASTVPRQNVVEIDVNIPKDFPTTFKEGFRSQIVHSFTLSDADGQPIPYQRLSLVPLVNERGHVTQMGVGERGLSCARYRVAVELDLPPLGFMSLLVRPCPTPNRCVGSLRTGPNSAENEHLSIEIATNGTLLLTDKSTGEVYRDLLMFEDRSEIGDGWFHGQSVCDEIVLSSAGTAQVSVVHDGPLMVTFRVTISLALPARFDWERERRSDARTELCATVDVSLCRGARAVDVAVAVENTVEDHRLRLLLPTDAASARTYWAHHPFDWVERDIELSAETATWAEMELAEKPFLGLQAIGDGRRGLALLSEGGVHEGGVVDDVRRTMQVTLLRSFRRTAGTLGEIDGLELGRLAYRFSLTPFEGSPPKAELQRALTNLQAGLMTRQTGKAAAGFPPLEGTAAEAKAFLLQEEGTLVVSAVKPPERGEGIIVRLWNPTDVPAAEGLVFWRPVTRATIVDLGEEPIVDSPVLGVDGHRVELSAPPRGIVTLRIDFGDGPAASR
ncbi:MAG: hypothetical protein HON70_45580, partial [Lentisphaerae bacterium]|nr:hypothetical protein [Lentisphaerota bacterium]